MAASPSGTSQLPIPGIRPAANGAGTARFVRDRLPAAGLFAEQEWRLAPGPFVLPQGLAQEIDSLGRIFLQFYRALQGLYRRSVDGKAPAWIAQLLDQGKPPELVELQRHPSFRTETPRVIRPDLLLAEDGLWVTELDSVPGGIGLTTWLYEAYESALLATANSAPTSGEEALPGSTAGSAPGFLGSSRRMLEGFAGIFGEASRVHLVVSKESATYRPEMAWLASRIAERDMAVRDEVFEGWSDGDAVYRFFELFDLPNIPAAAKLFADASARRIRLTPPPKPLFEEKLAFALLWNRNLRAYWRQELGEGFLKRLLRVVPYTWVVDPAPLPPQGAYPELGLTDWRQLADLSQKERDLILKVSGFSDQAWGARGVYLGSDLSATEWAAAVETALGAWPRTPYVLQRYRKPGVVEGAWFDPEAGEVRPMPSRVRLCPYYFVHGEGDAARPHLGGVLATLCPADKKIIHGMRDAVLAPCAVEAAPRGGRAAEATESA